MARYKYLKIVCDACCHISEAHKKRRSIKGKSAGGIIFIDEFGEVVSRAGVYLGELTPPQAEYKTIVEALDKASGVCRGEIEVWTDSEFVVKQLNGEYGIKSENMKPLHDEVKKLGMRFTKIDYFHHGRGTSLARQADELAEKEYKKYQS